ncbi:SRPBCC family protein [Pedobacter africanus]|uniref:Ligand-binding SRPBCC domain-containing protein n=1 Tax=Pedobacter africanus TaxID=151894 RepID=A0A1W1ZGB5_9SPHI|nr:SRPBCC family protein [Pedobacter africanus]SMC47068.1 Ligand-binding SRPBCC domain-containing protein [Pedobacter africanus]
MGKIYQLKREQQLYCDIQTAWDFFSSPNNLSRITPEEMGFVVLSKLTEAEIYKGMTIDYTVSPVLGIPLRWQTEITEVNYQKSFTDFQKKGPYKLWRHRHEFIPNQRGVMMIDTVDYELPFGIIGQIAHGLFVKKKLNTIFNFRHQVLEQLFNPLR